MPMAHSCHSVRTVCPVLTQLCAMQAPILCCDVCAFPSLRALTLSPCNAPYLPCLAAECCTHRRAAAAVSDHRSQDCRTALERRVHMPSARETCAHAERSSAGCGKGGVWMCSLKECLARLDLPRLTQTSPRKARFERIGTPLVHAAFFLADLCHESVLMPCASRGGVSSCSPVTRRGKTSGCHVLTVDFVQRCVDCRGACILCGLPEPTPCVRGHIHGQADQLGQGGGALRCRAGLRRHGMSQREGTLEVATGSSAQRRCCVGGSVFNIDSG